jgi:hypothetical protein
VPIQYVSEQLGHSSIKIGSSTLNRGTVRLQ